MRFAPMFIISYNMLPHHAKVGYVFSPVIVMLLFSSYLDKWQATSAHDTGVLQDSAIDVPMSLKSRVHKVVSLISTSLNALQGIHAIGNLSS